MDSGEEMDSEEQDDKLDDSEELEEEHNSSSSGSEDEWASAPEDVEDPGMWLRIIEIYHSCVLSGKQPQNEQESICMLNGNHAPTEFYGTRSHFCRSASQEDNAHGGQQGIEVPDKAN